MSSDAFKHWPAHLIDNRDIEEEGFRWCMRDEFAGVPVQEPIIINMDDKESQGTHWCLVYRPNEHEIYYLGPLGNVDMPPQSVFDFAKKIGSSITQNRTQYMPSASNLCGYICLTVAEALRAAKPSTAKEVRSLLKKILSSENAFYNAAVSMGFE
jgi:hypothetical protein